MLGKPSFEAVGMMSFDPFPIGRICKETLQGYLEDHPRILVVNKHGDRWCPLSSVVGSLPNGLFMAYKWGLLTTY